MTERAFHTVEQLPVNGPIEDWIKTSPRELGVDVLEKTAKRLDMTEDPSSVWPGDPVTLDTLLYGSDYLRKAETRVFKLDDGTYENVGKQMLAHQVRAGFYGLEIAQGYERLHPEASLPSPRQIFDAVSLHDLGKTQLEMHLEGITSERTDFSDEERQWMFGHAELSAAMLRDLFFKDGKQGVGLDAQSIQLIETVARCHHALHPRELQLAEAERILTDEMKHDRYLMYALMICSLSDTADATRYRAYMEREDPIKCFPAWGSYEEFDAWTTHMVQLPPDIDAEIQTDLKTLKALFYQVLNDSDSITHHLLRMAP